MTTAQKLKKSQEDLEKYKSLVQEMKAVNSFLNGSERAFYERRIKFLEDKLIDKNKTYDLMLSYKNAFLKEKSRNYELKKQNNELNRKIKFLHKEYKHILKEQK